MLIAMPAPQLLASIPLLRLLHLVLDMFVSGCCQVRRLLVEIVSSGCGTQFKLQLPCSARERTVAAQSITDHISRIASVVAVTWTSHTAQEHWQ